MLASARPPSNVCSSCVIGSSPEAPATSSFVMPNASVYELSPAYSQLSMSEPHTVVLGVLVKARNVVLVLEGLAEAAKADADLTAGSVADMVSA